MTLGRLARGFFVAAAAATAVATGAWCSLAVWFRFPGSEPVRALLSGAVGGFALAAAVRLATSRRRAAPAVYAVLVVLILAWWASITPMNDRDWAPDVARSATARIEGKRLTITNVRDFAWRSETDFDQRWDQRTYDLSSLSDVDLIMSYWAGEAIAHTILSFRFADGARIAFSIETRKQSGEPYSALAGFFKQYELAIVAADERDVVRVRSNIRREDVRIYRLRIAPERAQKLLKEYVEEMNGLAHTPRFYNTLTTNCTTLVFQMVRAVHPGLPLDPRVLLSGYLPDYVYELGAMDTDIPFKSLREVARIGAKAALADADPSFSERIREDLPAALEPRSMLLRRD